MRVGGDADALCFTAHLRAPQLREGEEIALFRREAIDLGRRRLVVERFLQSQVGDLEAAQVGDILAER